MSSINERKLPMITFANPRHRSPKPTEMARRGRLAQLYKSYVWAAKCESKWVVVAPLSRCGLDCWARGSKGCNPACYTLLYRQQGQDGKTAIRFVIRGFANHNYCFRGSMYTNLCFFGEPRRARLGQFRKSSV